MIHQQPKQKLKNQRTKGQRIETMASKETKPESHLIHLCIDSALQSKESIERWRRQRRSLERLPSQLAEALFYGLLRRRLLQPSLLELFKNTIEDVDLKDQNSVDAEWMAYLGAFRYLRSLNIANCYRITNSALWSIAGMTTLREVNFSRCANVTDAGVRHLLTIPMLEKVYISETAVTANGVMLLSSLTNLSVLDLGGLPVTDQALSSLQVLNKLKHLDLWGSKLSNKGALILKTFPNLTFLNLAWTDITNLPSLSSIKHLNLSNCTIHSIFEGKGDKSHLHELIFSGATFSNELEVFSCINTTSLTILNVSNTSLHNFNFLPYMNRLIHLDLSSCSVTDNSVEFIVSIGANLRNLNLSNTKVSTVGVTILNGHVPNLEVLSLSNSHIDDAAILCIGLMPSLKVIDLSKTNITGFAKQVGEKSDWILSLTALQHLTALERLNLENTRVKDAALFPLSEFQTLTHLSLKSDSLTDILLHQFSSSNKLKDFCFQDGVISDSGLGTFDPPLSLKKFDLRGCWLLSKDGISSFCKHHPQIEVQHEHAHFVPSDKIVSTRSRKTSQAKQKQGKVSVSHSKLVNDTFLDQRLKYTREELLALQTTSLAVDPPHD